MTSEPMPARVGSDQADLVIVGAGPAGLAAAATALLGGLRVALLDSGGALGGQYWRRPPPGMASAGSRAAHQRGPYEQIVRVLERSREAGRLDLRLGHHGWTSVRRGALLEVHAVDRSGGPGAERAVRVFGRHLLIATGAFDRQLPFPGWDLPGVYTAGGLQALLKGGGVVAGERVVVGGTGPFLLPVATGLAAAGAAVVALCEANDPRRWVGELTALRSLPGKVREAAGYGAALARHRIPVHTRSAVVAAHGQGRVEEVTIGVLDAHGALTPAGRRRVSVDAVGVGWGFVPQLDLAITLGAALGPAADGNQVVRVDEWQRTSVPGLCVAGEACGVGGWLLALREGQLAAEGVLRDLGRAPVVGAAGLRAVRRTISAHRRFADAMHRAHPVPAGWSRWLTGDTLLCRCEEVTVDRVREAVHSGAADGRQVKQLTRAGMGWCQGRICAYAADCLAREGEVADSRHPGAVTERLVAGPVPLGALAALHPDVTISAM